MKFKKMLSFMTAAAISASCMAGLYVVASADESTVYAEYVFDQDNNTEISATTPTAAITYQKGLTVVPVLTTNAIDKKYSATQSTHTCTLPYSGQSHEWSKASKGSNGAGFTLTTNLSQNEGVNAYNVTCIYSSHSNEKSSGCTIKSNSKEYVSTNDSTSTTDVRSVTVTGLKDDELTINFGGGIQARVYYIGIEYYMAAPSETDAPTDAPTDTPKPSAKPAEPVEDGVEGTTETLKAATATKTYDLRKPAAEANSEPFEWGIRGAVYITGHLYFGNEILAAGTSGPMYYSDKGSEDLNGAPHGDGIRLKVGQDDIAVKLAAGATVETRVKGGGGGDRVAIISSTAPEIETKEGDLATSENLANYAVKDISYTNDTGAEKVVYLSATGDSFISQIKVTVPATEPTAQTAEAKGETFDDPEGGAVAASFKTDAVPVKGTIRTAQWKITASDGNAPQEATVNVDDLNIPEFSGESSAIFGIIITNIKTGVTIDSARFVYTVD